MPLSLATENYCVFFTQQRVFCEDYIRWLFYLLEVLKNVVNFDETS